MTTIRNDYSAPLHLPFTLPPKPSTAPGQHVSNHSQDTVYRRALEEILEHPLFSDLNKHGKPHGAGYLDINKFYKQVGGNWNDKSLSPLEQLNFATKALLVLVRIDSMGGAYSKQNDNRIDGVMPDRPTLEARHISNTVHADSEFMRLLDYCDRGEEALSGTTALTEIPRTSEEIKNGPYYSSIKRLMNEKISYIDPQTKKSKVILLIDAVKARIGDWDAKNLSKKAQAEILDRLEKEILIPIDKNSGAASAAGNQEIDWPYPHIPTNKFVRPRSIDELTQPGSEAYVFMRWAIFGDPVK